jgi:pimeloyl-ACP methyl ester carboxylesterase
VSAKKKGGVTQFVTVKSLIGSPCAVWTDIPNPKIAIDGSPVTLKASKDGRYRVPLKKGATVTFTPVALNQADLVIKPISVGKEGRNLFGLNEKTTRLPGHQHYYGTSPKSSNRKAPATPVKASRDPLPSKAGRYVRIELPGEQRTLSLAEVEVFAGGKNVALRQKATQSSTRFGGNPERAVDGNTDGDYRNGSVTHTDLDGTNPWWEVDLGRMANVEQVLVHNRTDCLGNRLDGFTLTILDVKRNVVFSKEKVPQSAVISLLQPGAKSSQVKKTVVDSHAAEGSAHLFPGVKTDFRGYDRYDRIKTAKGHFSIVCPKNPAPGKPWLWRSLFWEAIKRFSNADLKLVDEGYHVVLAHGDVAGHPSGNANIDAAYELLTKEYGFSNKCSMASMSRGTLSLFRWASANPEKVDSIYVDNGVCNVLSWPAGNKVPGNTSIGTGDPRSWEDFKRKFGYATDEEALKTKESPIDLLEPLAKARVPILMVCGNKDHAVPYEENDAIMEQRYKALGGDITVIVENKGHSHGMKDPTPVLEFIRKHTQKLQAQATE